MFYVLLSLFLILCQTGDQITSNGVSQIIVKAMIILAMVVILFTNLIKEGRVCV